MKTKFSKYKTRVESKEEMGEWMGMNKPAAKEMKLKKPKIKDKEVLVRKDLDKKERKETRKHEIAEAEMIEKGGLKYKAAHKKALKLEKLSTPTIKKRLKK